MNKIIKLKSKPQIFKRLTGISVEKFEEVIKKLKPLYEHFDHERLNRPNRQRKPGAGNQYKLTLEERLMMLLMYYRLYITHAFLGVIFGIDDSNVGRNINPVQKLLAKIFKLPNKVSLIYVRHNQNTWHFECGVDFDPSGWMKVSPPQEISNEDLEFYRNLRYQL